jgi:adenosylmethionine-8-amino-7-oxononanoate aminotransferase
VQQVIRRDRLLDNVQVRGRQLAQRLHERFADHPFVGDIRGRGLFWGVELVADRETKVPFDARHRIHARIKSEALARGLMVYPMGGTIDGCSGDHVLLAPPFIASASDIETIVARLGEAVDAATVTMKAVVAA